MNLVQVDAVVYDRHGHAVTNLKPEDFEVLEDGRRQPVTAFSYIQLNPAKSNSALPVRHENVEAPVPAEKLEAAQVKRTIVLVADDLNLSWQSTAYLHRALRKFIDTQMGPNDMVSITRTSTGLGALENFTNDKRELYAAADAVHFNLNGRARIGIGDLPVAAIPSRPQAATSALPGTPSPVAGSGSEDESDYLFFLGTMNAVTAIIDNLRDLPGRKAIILFSDGVPASPRGDFIYEIQQQLHRVADSANRSSVILNCVDARGLQTLAGVASDAGPPSQNPVAESRGQTFAQQQDGLTYLAAQTGGRAILNGNDMTWAIDRVLDDLNGYYLIGYRPEPGTFHQAGQRPAFHRIQVRVTRPGLSVRSRAGFFGVTDQESEPKHLSDGQKLLTALQSPFGSNGIPLKLTVQFLSDGAKRSSLATLLHIDARSIDFQKGADAKYHARVELLLTGYDETGRAVEGANNVLDLALPLQQYQSALSDGIVYSQQVLVARSGAAHVRVAVRDMATGQVGSTSAFVLLPDLKKNRMIVGTVVMGNSSNDPAARVFKTGQPIPYRYSILNSRKGGDDVTRVETEVRLFHDGREVWASIPATTEARLAKDSRKLVADSALHLSSNFEPGEYYLQVIARDLLARKRSPAATQWINFDLQPE